MLVAKRWFVGLDREWCDALRFDRLDVLGHQHQYGEAALPAGFTLDNARLELTPQGVENATKTTVNTSIEGKGAVADLSSVIESVYGKRPTARTFDAHVYVNAVKNGQAVLIDAGNINLVMTPKAPFIDSNYYMVGQMTNWSLDTKFKFTHSDADVYEDPVFTIMFTTTEDDQYWKIIPQGNVDTGNIWAVENAPKGVVGIETDGAYAMSGTLLTTTSKGEKAGAGKIAKAGIYQMTINMMDYTYSIEQIADYYLVGALQSWSDKDMSCLMTAESAMVLSFTTKWTKLANQNPTEFEYVSLIGVGGNWNDGDDIDLTQVAPHNWYKANVEIPEGGFKIRADHKWRDDGNWGFGKGQKYESKGTLITSGGSSNIPVPAGTYNIYFNDITGAYAFVNVK